MQQEIRFCTAADGVRIGYATMGSGPPLVKAANYLTHLEHERHGQVWAHWLNELSAHHTLIRYDARGSGLSDWNTDRYSIEAWVQDLEAVVEATGIDRFPLLGISQGASVSIAYAAKYPERVSHLILYGGYARGRYNRDLTPRQREEADTMINIIRVGWGQDNPAFRNLFTTLLIPEGSDEQVDWLNELARISATPDNAAAMERAFYHIDVTESAKKVQTPALVLHAREDACIPFAEGRLMATLLPDARFVTLESRNHVLLQDEPAWARFVSEVRAFMGTEPVESSAKGDPESLFPELTPRQCEVLGLIARGFSNDEIADRLFISSKTVRNHITQIFDKLQVDSRAKAIILAREAGLGLS